MKIKQSFIRWLWQEREGGEMKHLSPIDVIKHCTQYIIKPLVGPTEILDALGPNWEQVPGETCGELGSNYNIFDVDADNGKHERSNIEVYRLTVRKTKGFGFHFHVEE